MNAAIHSLDHAMKLRSTLAAVYATHGETLRRRASFAIPNHAHAWDVVQEAYLHVLDHPPADVSRASVAAALDVAVHVVTERTRRSLRDDAAMRLALEKRSP